MAFGLNVMDFGAKGDGLTDDTQAIQAAINAAAERGGGTVLFPYARNGYRIASPGIGEYEGRALRAQLYIPPGCANIRLEGEMPCRMLSTYQIPPEGSPGAVGYTRFGTMRNDNTFLFSTWEPPEEHDPEARPWSILSVPEGDSCKGHFSLSMFSLKNLEFRVHLDHEKMYPTQSAVNLQNVARIHVQDCQFCLDDQVGDTFLGKELQPNPCHTVGLMTSGDQNDNNVLRNVSVQGFRYGLVMSEHVVAEYLYVHNCEEGMVFHDCSHVSLLCHVAAQHNKIILSTTRDRLFGHDKGPCAVEIGSVNFECGTGLRPVVSRLQYGVYDPENRLRGHMRWYKPWGKQEFPVMGAENYHISHFCDE